MEHRNSICLLRPWRDDDVETLARLADNAAIWSCTRDLFPHPYNRSDAVEWVEYAQVTERELALAVCAPSGELAGGIGLGFGSDINRYSAEIGYWIGEPYWGRGIATAAVRLLVSHAFDGLGLLRLFALPFADNRASCRVLEKAGFACEGRMRASAVKGGEVRDQLCWARVNEEWRGSREK